jgi:KDO2-lipid IV(A) lauroyltransferase
MPLLPKILDALVVFVLRDVTRYRFKIIRDNLQSSFAYSDHRELRADISSNYYFLARILRQIVFKPSINLLNKHLKIKDKSQVETFLRQGRSVIVTLGHVGNWEWICLYMGLQFPGQTCALYKRIKSDRINSFMIRRRTIVKGHLIDGGKPGDLIKLIKSQPVVVLMIADQNPGHDRGMIWTDFFGKETAFISGPESIATKYHLPVMYLHNHSTQDDGYNISLEMIYDGESVPEPGEITKRYARALEQNISAQRSEWLWSHRRWKRKRSIEKHSFDEVDNKAE